MVLTSFKNCYYGINNVINKCTNISVCILCHISHLLFETIPVMFLKRLMKIYVNSLIYVAHSGKTCLKEKIFSSLRTNSPLHEESSTQVSRCIVAYFFRNRYVYALQVCKTLGLTLNATFMCQLSSISDLSSGELNHL